MHTVNEMLLRIDSTLQIDWQQDRNIPDLPGRTAGGGACIRTPHCGKCDLPAVSSICSRGTPALLCKVQPLLFFPRIGPVCFFDSELIMAAADSTDCEKTSAESTATAADTKSRIVSGPARLLCLTAGLLFTGLGVLGVIVPGLPTTPFLLLALAMFARSSPRLHQLLLNSRALGPYLQEWRKYRAISYRVRNTAVLTVVIGLSITLLAGTLPGWLKAVTLVAGAIGLAVVLRLPVRRPDSQTIGGAGHIATEVDSSGGPGQETGRGGSGVRKPGEDFANGLDPSTKEKRKC